MYIPAENVYYESLLRAQDRKTARASSACDGPEGHPGLTPHLLAYLLVILHGMKGMKFELEAREIQDQLGALPLQFEAFWVAFEKVGVHLGNAVKQFEESDRQAAKVHGRSRRSPARDRTPMCSGNSMSD